MIQVEKQEILFDGNEKQIFATTDENYVVVHFKDVTTAYGGVKRARFKGIGCVNNDITSILFSELEKAGIPTHFIGRYSEREMLCLKVANIPVEVIVHNRIAGTLARKLGMEEGLRPKKPVIDIRYNNRSLGKPMINGDMAVALGLVSEEEMNRMHSVAEAANDVLKPLFESVGIDLIDFKIEFGRTSDGRLVVSDELSPDRCRLWDSVTGEKLDKDRFRHDLADIKKGYDEVLMRLSDR